MPLPNSFACGLWPCHSSLQRRNEGMNDSQTPEMKCSHTACPVPRCQGAVPGEHSRCSLLRIEGSGGTQGA